MMEASYSSEPEKAQPSASPAACARRPSIPFGGCGHACDMAHGYQTRVNVPLASKICTGFQRAIAVRKPFGLRLTMADCSDPGTSAATWMQLRPFDLAP